MKSMEQKYPYFKYAIMRDANSNQSPIGVVWKKNIMCEAFRQFGHIIYINSMKSQIKIIHWPYSEHVVLDEECILRPFVRCFHYLSCLSHIILP